MEYQRQYNALTVEYERISENIRRAEARIKERTDHRRRLEVFLQMMMVREECEAFAPYTFVTLVDRVTIGKDKTLEFVFRSGMQYEYAIVD